MLLRLIAIVLVVFMSGCGDGDRSMAPFANDVPEQTAAAPKSLAKPKVTITVSPQRLRLLENVYIGITCSQSGDNSGNLEYRYKLGMPVQAMLAGVGLRDVWGQWGPWTSGTGVNINYQNFYIEGSYTISAESRNTKTGEKSGVVTSKFNVYWEYPEIREAALTIDWTTANKEKDKKKRYAFLASEYKVAYETWQTKWEADYRIIKASTSAQEMINKVSSIIVTKSAMGVLKNADAGVATTVGKLLTVKTIYALIKEGLTDLVLIYRNVQTNVSMTMTAYCYAMYQIFTSAAR